MKPFIIIDKFNILAWDKPSILAPKNQEEAIQIQQRLEYGLGIQSQVVPGKPKVINLGNHGGYPL